MQANLSDPKLILTTLPYFIEQFKLCFHFLVNFNLPDKK